METKTDIFSLTSKEGTTYMSCHPSEAKNFLFERSGSLEELTLRIFLFQKIEEPVNIKVKVRGLNNEFFVVK